MITGCGQGNLDYLIPGLLGFLTGGVLFGVTYQSFFLKISNIGSYGQKTLEDLLHVNHWLFVAMFVLATLLFYVSSQIMEHPNTETLEQPGTGTTKQHVTRKIGQHTSA